MKKLVALLLTLALIFAMSIPAFATGNDPGTDGSYKAYRLLTLSSSLKEGTLHPTNCDGTNHADACYNYRYEFHKNADGTPGKYAAILQEEVFTHAAEDFWADNKPDLAGVTAVHVTEYLAAHTGDTGTAYGSIRQVADRLYREIMSDSIVAEFTGADLDAVVTAINGGEDTMGYWMIADVRNLNDAKNSANALVVMDTKGELPLKINISAKISYPTIEKMVKDIEDSEDGDITTNAWVVSADHDIGDEIPFKIAVTLPNNLRAYTEYNLTIHDTMEKGLVMTEDLVDAVKVSMYDSHNKAHADIDGDDGAVIPEDYYDIVYNKDANTLTVTFDDVKDIPGIGSNYVIVVYYKAQLTEDAVLGAQGNGNTAYATYSNNPYDTNSNGKTEEVETKVFTYQLQIDKVDSFGEALKGAEFALYKYTKEPGKIPEESTDPMEQQGYILIPTDTEVTANTVTFTWTGLDDGDYILKETTVPEGYNGMKDISFGISAEHTSTGEPVLTSLSGGDLNGTVDLATGKIVAEIENKAGVVLPETGAAGTMMILGGSVMLIMIAVVFMVTRKKMSIYED